jgi:hypothetical protein
MHYFIISNFLLAGISYCEPKEIAVDEGRKARVTVGRRELDHR